jgi:UDP-N-acetylmuramyl pentapeptide phosphotransferase/UDP-N-acetylglucosamine-1-phosphate transferase
MSAAGLLIGAVLCAAATGLGVAALLPALRRWRLDPVNARSSHSHPTPRGGGLAFVPVICAALLLQGQGGLRWLGLAAVPLALLGWIDDRRPLPARWRYLLQLATAGLLLALAALPLPLGWLPLALVAITALINFTNFMDGLDGLVALALALVLTGAAVLLQAPALLLAAAALLGFLAFNWAPAQVFMGDVGSTFLGALLAGVVLQARGPGQALMVLLLAFPLLADAGSTVLRRAWWRQPLAQAHRLHLYQRLQQAGWSHRRVALLFGLASALQVLAALGGGLLAALAGAAMILAIGVQLDRRVAVPFRTSRSPQDHPR